MWTKTTLCILLFSTLANGAEKQIKLQDIERDNLSSNQRPQKQYQREQEEERDQNISEQSNTKLGNPQAYNIPEQQIIFQPQHQRQQILAYPQVPNVALYPTFFAPGAAPALQNNHIGPGSFVVPDYQTAAVQAAYLAPRGISAPVGAPPTSALYFPPTHGLQYVYPAPVQAPALPQTFSQQPILSPSIRASFSHQAPVVKHPAEFSQTPSFKFRGFQPPRPATLDSAYTQQSNFNPIPRELQSYTTIPESVYQGREPAYSQDTAPAVSLTNDQQDQYNLQQQRPPSLQRPIFSPGIKNVAPTNQLKGGFSNNGNTPGATRHFPSSGVNYNTYKRGTGTF